MVNQHGHHAIVIGIHWGWLHTLFIFTYFLITGPYPQPISYFFSEMASLNETNNRVPKRKRTDDVSRQVFKAATTGNAANLDSVLQSMHGR